MRLGWKAENYLLNCRLESIFSSSKQSPRIFQISSQHPDARIIIPSPYANTRCLVSGSEDNVNPRLPLRPSILTAKYDDGASVSDSDSQDECYTIIKNQKVSAEKKDDLPGERNTSRRRKRLEVEVGISSSPGRQMSPDIEFGVTNPSDGSTQYRYTQDDPIRSRGTRQSTISDAIMASYIAGPDPQDHKFECLYPSCGKRFGKKYNIQSHIQTHLSDRPHECDTCNATFVRRHDLWRHEKIHCDDQSFACVCRKSFARRDALTRHRRR